MQEAIGRTGPDVFDITAAICRRGLSFVAIGRAMEPSVTGEAVWRVLHGKSTSARIVDEIARVTFYTVDEVQAAINAAKERQQLKEAA